MEIFDRRELQAIIEGDTEAFREFFGRVYVPLVQHAAFYVADAAVAEDIVQDVFAHIWDHRREFAKVDNLEGYLLRWVRNGCINWLKRRDLANKYRQAHMLQEASVVDADPEVYYKAIYELIGRMPGKRREVFEMSVFHAKTYAQIAEITGTSVNTVKEHIKAAYAFLRKESAHIPYP